MSRSAGSTPFRCATASEARAEPLVGTASTVRAFLLVECPGPWGIDAVSDCRLPDPVKQRLRELESRHHVRPLLVRRPAGATGRTSGGATGRTSGGATGRTSGGAMRVFAAYVDHARPWVETRLLADPRDLLALDLTGLGSGRRPGLAPYAGPLFLVCTHGRHDACCAERGRPLAAALAGVEPEGAWEVSHIGGDRFAGNLLALPHGLYYGRLGPEDAPGLVARHRVGELDLRHLRGRSSYPFPVQAGEIFLRRHLDHHDIDPFPVVEQSRHGDLTRITFLAPPAPHGLSTAPRTLDAAGTDPRAPGSRGGCVPWEVAIRTERQPPRRLTCRSGDGIGQLHTLVRVIRG